MLGIPVEVVFFNKPVDNPASDVPLILPTTVADCVPITSPDKLPEKLDERYASKSTETALNRIGWLIITGVILALLALVMK